MTGIPYELINAGGPVGLLGLVVFMIMMGWLVPGRQYRRLEAERDQWQNVALKSMGHTDALMPAAQIATELTKSFADATTEAIEGRKP